MQFGQQLGIPQPEEAYILDLVLSAQHLINFSFQGWQPLRESPKGADLHIIDIQLPPWTFAHTPVASGLLLRL